MALAEVGWQGVGPVGGDEDGGHWLGQKATRATPLASGRTMPIGCSR